ADLRSTERLRDDMEPRDRRRERSVHVDAPWLALALLVGCALLPRPAHARETGTTQVTVTLDRTRFVVEIVLDPEALVARLDRGARVTAVEGASPGSDVQ